MASSQGKLVYLILQEKLDAVRAHCYVVCFSSYKISQSVITKS